jgi:neutrophil factor 2
VCPPFCSDYTQLGLPFNLFLPEIHFNLALCHIKLKDVTKGMYELRKASTRKMTPAHEVIEEAIEKRGEGFTVFSIVSVFVSLDVASNEPRLTPPRGQPVGVLFRPSENKLKNLAPKDYKGKAVSSSPRSGMSPIDRRTRLTQVRYVSGRN